MFKLLQVDPLVWFQELQQHKLPAMEWVTVFQCQTKLNKFTFFLQPGRNRCTWVSEYDNNFGSPFFWLSHDEFYIMSSQFHICEAQTDTSLWIILPWGSAVVSSTVTHIVQIAWTCLCTANALCCKE